VLGLKLRIVVSAVVVAMLASACGFSLRQHVGRPGDGHHYLVYWDQNEQQDVLSMPSGRIGQLVPPWDPNGQMCLLPDHSGRFVVGYNPTLPSQHNPGSLKPYKQPPVGEAMYDRNGTFTGTLFVPGPYHLPGQTVGGDIPPDTGSGNFNNNGTMTGCAFDHHANLFASDLGTAQGAFPPPDNGRIIEWFAPRYNTFCVVDGPTTGGDGAHHVDGTGGLRQPGDLAVDRNDNLLVPEAGAIDSNGLPAGRVLRFEHSSLPRRASDCGPDGLYPRSRIQVSVFVQGSLTDLPFPIALARDPICHCWAIASTIGDPAIQWFDDSGRPVPGHGTVPGESIAQIGQDPNGYNPFGLAFAPDGTLYVIDIHIQCSGLLTNCGPTKDGGRVLRVPMDHGQPAPVQVVASGYNFPTSVTTCDPDRTVCPSPRP
jgi:hypothetical protein